jgi:hypothetical protein
MNLVIILLYVSLKTVQGLIPSYIVSNKRFIPMNATKKDIMTNNKPSVLLIMRPNYSLDSQDISEILQQKKTEGFDHRYDQSYGHSYENDLFESKLENNFRLLHIIQKLENPKTSIYKKEEITIQFLKDRSEKSTYSPNPFDVQICREFLEFME